ncbi:MAG: hypothetical protein MZV63_64340 [Marinilabiliales bacterium]|nr:hypothetical protein [Marinilabiliales bacterium]
MSLKEFISSRVFFRQLAIAMVIGVAMIIVLIIWLNIHPSRSVETNTRSKGTDI